MAAVAANAHGTPDSCGSCANSRKCALGSRTDSASVQCLMLGIGTQFVEHADKKRKRRNRRTSVAR